jgi:diacylglycerol kinase (ATP)
MTKPVKVILNTFGGKLDAATKTALVEQGMQAAGINFEIAPTEHAGHGIELAHQAVADGHPIIAAAGGDGTINEVLNGMMQANVNPQNCSLAVLSMGSANDLVNTLGIPTDIAAACRRIAAGNSRLIDVGRVNGHYFANNSAVGLEPVVTITQHHMRRIKGTPRYVVAALKSIFTADPWQVDMTWDGGSFSGPVVLVSVGNGPRTGGAFYMTPKAKVDDGQFDFIYGKAVSRWELLRLLPQTFSGKHINHPKAGYERTQKLVINLDPPSPIQADGEIIDTAATHVTYELLPARLRIIV